MRAATAVPAIDECRALRDGALEGLKDFEGFPTEECGEETGIWISLCLRPYDELPDNIREALEGIWEQYRRCRNQSNRRIRSGSIQEEDGLQFDGGIQ